MPEHFEYGYVTGTLVRSVGDGSDGDRLPDVVGATNVRPKFTRARGQYVTTAPPRLVAHEPVTAAVMPDGQVTGDVDDKGAPKPDATPGLWLVTGTYRVALGGHFPDLTIDVTPTHTQAAPLELALAVDYSPPPGTTVQTVALPSGASVGQVLGMTATGVGWVLPTGGGGEGGPHEHEGYLTADDLPDLSGYVKTADLPDLSGYLTADDLPAPPDLSGYVQTTDARLSDARPPTAHDHDARYVRTVNGTGPDAAGNVTVTGGGGNPFTALIRTPQVGEWMTSPNFNGQATSQAGEVRNSGRMPLCIPEPMTIDQVAFWVGTAQADATWTVALLDGNGTTITTVGTAPLDTTGQKTITLASALALAPGWYFLRGVGHAWNGAKFFTSRISGWGSASRASSPNFMSSNGFPPMDNPESTSWQQNVVVFWVRRSA